MEPHAPPTTFLVRNHRIGIDPEIVERDAIDLHEGFGFSLLLAEENGSPTESVGDLTA
jgi:hypothetical protein